MVLRGGSDDTTELGVVAVLVAGLSNLFADMLSAPDIAEPIEPFWPVYTNSVSLDVLWYSSPWANWGLFIAGVVLNAALWWRKRER